MKPFVLRVEQSIIQPYAARPGDRILVRPADARPVVLYRRIIARYSALLEQLRTGAVSAADPAAGGVFAELASLAALERIEELATQPFPASPPPRRPRGR